ncbi:MAG: hypothetical protein WC755_02700 [Candidatus Woesearchaeota archaeon]|jgi:hypothetical protein
MSIRPEKLMARRKLTKKVIGPKTFKSEETANKWAKEHNIKNYDLKDIRNLGANDKKIRVIVKK